MGSTSYPPASRVTWQAGSTLLGSNAGGYSPGTIVTYTAGTASADVDATNAAVTFVAPPEGVVLIRAQATVGTTAGTAAPAVMYWTLRQGAADVGAQQQMLSQGAPASGTQGSTARANAEWRITGLTPGATYTYKLGHLTNVGTGVVGTTYAGGAAGPLIIEAWSPGAAVQAALYTPPSIVADAAARTSISNPTPGLQVYELSTGRLWTWTGTAWQWVIGTGSSPYLADVFLSANSTMTGITLSMPVPFTGERIDRANAHSGGTYTAPIAARYRVKSEILATMPAAAQTILASIYVNGAEVRRGEELTVRGATIGDPFSVGVEQEVDVAAGATIRIGYTCTVAAAVIQGDASGIFSNALFDVVGY